MTRTMIHGLTLAALLAGGCSNRGPETAPEARTPTEAPAAKTPDTTEDTPAMKTTPTPAEAPKSIGSARMEDDGTLVLTLRAEDGAGAVGDGQFRYPKDHPQYAEVLAHIGGLEPGEEKPVPPWD